MLSIAPTPDPRSSNGSVDCVVGQNDAYEDRVYSPVMREEEEEADSPVREVASDTIDQLGQPTRCRLMMKMGPMTVEVGTGVVYPQDLFINEEVPIREGFAAVRIDIVHENMMDAQLEVPTDDDKKTLRLAQYTKVQWRRSLILTESTPSSATPTPPPPPPPPKQTTPPPPPPPPPGLIVHNHSIKMLCFSYLIIMFAPSLCDLLYVTCRAISAT